MKENFGLTEECGKEVKGDPWTEGDDWGGFLCRKIPVDCGLVVLRWGNRFFADESKIEDDKSKIPHVFPCGCEQNEHSVNHTGFQHIRIHQQVCISSEVSGTHVNLESSYVL